MKLFKRLTAAALSAIMLTATFGAGTTVHAAADTDKPITLGYVKSTWAQRLRDEKAKFPSGTYWNGGDEDSYTTTPCDHFNGNKSCNTTYHARSIGDQRQYLHTEYDEDRYGNGYYYLKQCCGFARKLSKDFFQTDYFVRYYIKNKRITYSAGGSELYTPQVGDNVRLFSYSLAQQGHSIFITEVNGSKVKFAECNGDLASCEILWDQTEYYENYTTNKLVTVDVNYLRKNAVFVERPYQAGDFNLNGKIDQSDVKVFKETMVDKGSMLKGSTQIKAATYADYDINGSLYVDDYDYYAIQNYAASAPENGFIVGSYKGSKQYGCYHNEVTDGYFLYNRGIYQVLDDTNTVTFVGPFCRDDIAFSVPSEVTNPDNGKTYKVTEIGTRDNHPRGCTILNTIASLGIPDTVTIINKYAFRNYTSQILQHIFFTGSNPQLKTIDEHAFMDCKLLTNLDLSDLNKLTTIGEQAFPKEMTRLVLPYAASGTRQLTPALGTTGIFENYQKTDATTMVLINKTSGIREVVLQDNDVQLLNMNKLILQVSGKVRVYNKNHVLLRSYNC